MIVAWLHPQVCRNIWETMSDTFCDSTEYLLAQARRCRRLAIAMADHAIRNILEELAGEYEAQAAAQHQAPVGLPAPPVLASSALAGYG